MLTEKSSDQAAEEAEEAVVTELTEDSEAPESDAPEPALELPEALETIPVPQDEADAAGAAGQLLEACPACATLMDVTDQAPFSEIFCPSCGQRLRARKQFNNYRLIEMLGEGGMGAVFKAVDCNLNRNVALKILKKECSANVEERAKLEKEARVTASINHPHVVKVFLFGEDHGQFYLAMELVGRGTLDQLMMLQRRVAEAQMLEVGIQIAQGLEAAFEHGLIHRDIKPGNILFSDSHSAKLVDFGLAIVMDEAAQRTGEIWGTPYYIAPEKLDNLPEDFRSDIYSLGGTLFHALSGRPPYEAETASMVALKQLKSQPISLQAFAPDVSSETAYVINRMLAKNPDDRYASYKELIEHLSYARSKLLERAQKPQKPKERVVMETQGSKNFMAFLSLGILLTLLISGGLVYAFRDKIFGDGVKATQALPSTYSPDEIKSLLRQGVKRMVDRQFDEAREEFNRLAALPETTQPMKNWLRMNAALATLLAGQGEKAAGLFDEIARADLYSNAEEDSLPANFFVEASKSMAVPDRPIPSSVTNIYSPDNLEAFGLLCFALHDWELGHLNDAGPLLVAFEKAKVPEPNKWIEDYKPLAKVYLDDYETLKAIEKEMPAEVNAPAAQGLMVKVRAARRLIQSGSRATDRLDALQKEVISKGAKP